MPKPNQIVLLKLMEPLCQGRRKRSKRKKVIVTDRQYIFTLVSWIFVITSHFLIALLLKHLKGFKLVYAPDYLLICLSSWKKAACWRSTPICDAQWNNYWEWRFKCKFLFILILFYFYKNFIFIFLLHMSCMVLIVFTRSGPKHELWVFFGQRGSLVNCVFLHIC